MIALQLNMHSCDPRMKKPACNLLEVVCDEYVTFDGAHETR